MAATAPAYRQVGTLQAPPALPVLVSVSVDADQQAVALWAGRRGAARLMRPGADGYPKNRNATRPLVALTRQRAGEVEPFSVTTLAGLPVALPQVQALSTAELVVVGTRCWWTADGPEHNAFLIAPDGTVQASGTLGDGINHLLADASDRLWVGYFDEGVFGNFGWGAPSGPEPLGSPGVVRWTSTGGGFEVDWRNDQDEVSIDECYSLNVYGDQAWTCSPGRFDVVRLDAYGDAPSTWPTGVSGVSGLLLAGDVVALLGEYTDRAALRIASLSGLPETTAQLTLPRPPSRRLSLNPKRPTVVTRGSQAHLFVGRNWFVFDLREFG